MKDTGDALEKSVEHDPSDLNDDWEDDFSDIYANPGEVVEEELG